MLVAQMLRIARIVTAGSIILLFLNYVFFIWFWHENLPIYMTDEKHLNATLDQFLKPRWPGSLGHSQVLEFLAKELQDMGFTVLRDKFFDQLNLTNVVGIINMEADNFLMLSCHYDSKLIKTAANYVGATDGPVSCAILLCMARSLQSFLNAEFAKRIDIGLVLVFFDGHESFHDVTEDTNSLNGSRRFAQDETIPLFSVEALITLNLIGAPNQIYMSHYENTYPLHKRLVNIEQKLRVAGQLYDCHQLFHNLKDHNSDIEDDHYPFLDEGVPVMHVVPHTFPDGWHTMADNLENLHFPTIHNVLAILTRFVYDYLKNHEESEHKI